MMWGCLGLWLALQMAPAVPQDLAPTARAEARLQASSEHVELGEPFELVLEVRHRSGDTARVEPGELAQDMAWKLLSGGELLSLPDGPGTRMSEVRWTVVALEPGRRSLPAPRVLLAGGGDAGELELEVQRGELEVAGVLAPGEDAARPLPAPVGLVEIASVGPQVLLAAAAGVVLLAIVVVVCLARWRARRRAATAPVTVSALERLAALAAVELRTPDEVREAHYSLSRALREHIDGARSQLRASLTDAEWAAALGASPEDELAQLLSACERVKYGAEAPTHWATRERVVRARALALAHAGPPAAGGAP